MSLVLKLSENEFYIDNYPICTFRRINNIAKTLELNLKQTYHINRAQYFKIQSTVFHEILRKHEHVKMSINV